MKVEQSFTVIDDKRYLKRRIEDFGRAINGQIEFGNPKSGISNMSGTWVNVTTGPAGTTFTVHHNLGRIPTGMLVFSVDQPGAVIHAVNKAAWTNTVAFFQCNVSNVSLQGFVS